MQLNIHSELIPFLQELPALSASGGKEFLHKMSESMDYDWDEFSKPDLLDNFSKQEKIVLQDVSNIKKQLTISDPQAWIGVLNRARMNLFAQSKLTEEQFETLDFPPSQSLPMFKMKIYTGLLSELVDLHL